MSSARSRYWPPKAHHFFSLLVHSRTQPADCLSLLAACCSYFDFCNSLLFSRFSLSKLLADLLFTYNSHVSEGLRPRTFKGRIWDLKKTQLCRVLYLTVYNNSLVRAESDHILIASQTPLGFQWLSKCGSYIQNSYQVIYWLNIFNIAIK